MNKPIMLENTRLGFPLRIYINQNDIQNYKFRHAIYSLSNIGLIAAIFNNNIRSEIVLFCLVLALIASSYWKDRLLLKPLYFAGDQIGFVKTESRLPLIGFLSSTFFVLLIIAAWLAQ